MSDDLTETNVAARVDEEVWQGWLAKNRLAEKRLHARLAKIAIAIAIAVAAFAAAWLLRS